MFDIVEKTEKETVLREISLEAKLNGGLLITTISPNYTRKQDYCTIFLHTSRETVL